MAAGCSTGAHPPGLQATLNVLQPIDWVLRPRPHRSGLLTNPTCANLRPAVPRVTYSERVSPRRPPFCAAAVRLPPTEELRRMSIFKALSRVKQNTLRDVLRMGFGSRGRRADHVGLTGRGTQRNERQYVP